MLAFALWSRKVSSPHQHLSAGERCSPNPPKSPARVCRAAGALPGLRLPAAPVKGRAPAGREGDGKRPGRWLGGPGGACVALPGRGGSARLGPAQISPARPVAAPPRAVPAGAARPRGAAPADAMPKPEVSASYQEVRGAGQGWGARRELVPEPGRWHPAGGDTRLCRRELGSALGTWGGRRHLLSAGTTRWLGCAQLRVLSLNVVKIVGRLI